MNHRKLSAVIAILVSAPLLAQSPAPDDWAQPRTPWGDPDLQGIWRYEATIPKRSLR